MPNVSVFFNGVLTNIGQHQFVFTVDMTTPDSDPDVRYGAFTTLSASINAPNIGLNNVAIVSPTFFFTNPYDTTVGQVALRLGAPGAFAGQFSPFPLPKFMTNANDLSTFSLPYLGTTTSLGSQWRTDGPAAQDLLLANGSRFNSGQDVFVSQPVTFSVFIVAVPEPSGMVLVALASLIMSNTRVRPPNVVRSSVECDC